MSASEQNRPRWTCSECVAPEGLWLNWRGNPTPYACLPAGRRLAGLFVRTEAVEFQKGNCDMSSEDCRAYWWAGIGRFSEEAA
jgi:hypothetical protein